MINEMDHTHGVINIVVHPEHRNKGIGTKLHKQVMDYAKQNNIKRLEVFIKKRLDHSVQFAQNRGFSPLLYAWEMNQEVAKIAKESKRPGSERLVFRKATIKDSATYATIINKVFGDYLESSVLGELLKDPSVMVYILERDGQAIGTTTVQLRTNVSVGYIYDVAILKEYRSQGLGSYMLIQAIGELGAHNIAIASLTVTGQNKKALSLYHKLGFRETDIDIIMGKTP